MEPKDRVQRDITDIPMARGFVYLTAVVDWFSRKVLAWLLSITMDVAVCIEQAMARFGGPEISAQWQRDCRANTDQGSQFASREYTALLIGSGIRISMDGKGA